ncbi:Striatin-interacting protein 2 [Aphelenchoides fujianensis]|nr:Striatin-interacting protein 2 [Aphelenchoides fujianensis]
MKPAGNSAGGAAKRPPDVPRSHPPVSRLDAPAPAAASTRFVEQPAEADGRGEKPVRIERQVRPGFANNIYGSGGGGNAENVSKVDVQLSGVPTTTISSSADSATRTGGGTTVVTVNYGDEGGGTTTTTSVNTHQPVVRTIQRPNLGISSFNTRPSSGGKEEDSELCESSLAQRRSAHLPKLRQLSSNLTNLSFEQSAFRHEMGDIDFEYADCDTFSSELAELYSYSEMFEWSTNLDSYLTFLRNKRLSTVWIALEKSEKQAVLADIIQYLEMSSASDRLEAARTLLYILQGAWLDLKEPRSEVVCDCMEEARRNLRADSEEQFLEEFVLLQAACNAYLAYEAGLFRTLCEVLLMEANEATEDRAQLLEQMYGASMDRNHSSMSTHSNARSFSSIDGIEAKVKKTTTMCENEMMRTSLSCLYHLVESIRRPDVLRQCTHVSDYSASRLEQLQQNFIKELRTPMDVIEKTLLGFCFDLIPPFIRGSCTQIPIKKVMLLAWKVMLASCGDMAEQKAEKERQRKANGLPPIEDTLHIACKMRATNFSAAAETTNDPSTRRQRRLGAFDSDTTRSRGRLNASRGAFNRQQALAGPALSGDESSTVSPLSSSPTKSSASSPSTAAPPPLPLDMDDDALLTAEEEEADQLRSSLVLNDDPKPRGDRPPASTETDRPAVAAFDGEPDGAAAAELHPPQVADTPVPPADGQIGGGGGDRQSANGDQTPVPSSPVPNVLPWSSKVRTADIEAFIDAERLKFYGYKLPGDGKSLFGFPPPVLKSVEALRRHHYVSIGELQAEHERNLCRFPFSHGELPNAGPIEDLYGHMIPTLPTDAICFLKVLLAAIPAPKAKLDSAPILSDVLAKPTDPTDMLSTSLNLEVSCSTHNVLEEAVRLAIDINRHKEIIVKATTAVLINMLKLFRLSHVYQFENLSQQLVLTNCLPLILKFLDQNMAKYFQSKNELAPLCFPRSVVHYATHNREWPVLNAENIAEESANERYYLWRNVFSSVNLLRILNKLTKNKHSRTMMLVVFKSAPILKRCLKVRLGIFQFYALKLLKMQARYLGRQWRRSNMDVISSIYMKIRHRLNDDWAFANETRCKLFDFQMEERDLKNAIERFNKRRYNNSYANAGIPLNRKARSPTGSCENDDEENDDDDELDDEIDPEDFDPVDYEPVDNSLSSVLSATPEFSAHFKRNYEKWVEDAVFRNPIDWDEVIQPAHKLNECLKAKEPAGIAS